MKRTPLARGKGLQRGQGLARGTKRLPPRSAKRAAQYAQPGGRRDLVAQLLAAYPRCQVRALCRGARAVDVHERLKRSRGGNILDPEQAHMVTACRDCHEWTEREPKAATAARMLLPSWHVCPEIGPC